MIFSIECMPSHNSVAIGVAKVRIIGASKLSLEYRTNTLLALSTPPTSVLYVFNTFMNILYNTVGIVTLKTRATSVGNAVKNFASSSIGIIFVYHAYKKTNPNNPLKIKKLSINTDFGGGDYTFFSHFIKLLYA